jgi:hypothetical protein
MPTILIVQGFRFFFYSNENDEPIHIHVQKADSIGKIWLMPEVKVAYFKGFNNTDTRAIMQIIKENNSLLIQKWNEYFPQ